MALDAVPGRGEPKGVGQRKVGSGHDGSGQDGSDKDGSPIPAQTVPEVRPRPGPPLRIPRQSVARQGVKDGRTAGPVTRVQPNLGDYVRTRRDFSWEAARSWLTGLPGGRGLNIAYEAVDRHADGARATQVALRCRDRNGRITELTYAELRTSTSRFANLLRDLGVGPGERVFTMLGRVPELYVTALGTVKSTSVYAPMPADLGVDAVLDRLERAEARVLVTTTEQYKRKVAPIRDRLTRLEHVLVIGDGVVGDSGAAEGTIDLHAALAAAAETFDIPPTDPQAPALLHFTSGTTGTPKATIHAHQSVVAQHATAGYALDLHAGDVFWCTVDPGGITGTSYNLIAPFTHATTLVVDDADFDVRGCYELMQEQRVTVRYSEPSTLRKLMRHGVDLAACTTSRRCASSRAWASRSIPRSCCGDRRRSDALSTTPGRRRRPGPS